jgi:hypothetical protein
MQSSWPQPSPASGGEQLLAPARLELLPALIHRADEVEYPHGDTSNPAMTRFSNPHHRWWEVSSLSRTGYCWRTQNRDILGEGDERQGRDEQ